MVVRSDHRSDAEYQFIVSWNIAGVKFYSHGSHLLLKHIHYKRMRPNASDCRDVSDHPTGFGPPTPTEVCPARYTEVWPTDPTDLPSKLMLFISAVTERLMIVVILLTSNARWMIKLRSLNGGGIEIQAVKWPWGAPHLWRGCWVNGVYVMMEMNDT